MKAIVQTTPASRSRIVKFLESLDLKVDEGEIDLAVEGEMSEVVGALVELRYKFPTGYVQGRTMPEPGKP